MLYLFGLALGVGFGVAVALYAFMADAVAAAGGGFEAIRRVLPVEFNWPLYLVALALLAAPLAEVTWQWVHSRSLRRVADRLPTQGRIWQ